MVFGVHLKGVALDDAQHDCRVAIIVQRGFAVDGASHPLRPRPGKCIHSLELEQPPRLRRPRSHPSWPGGAIFIPKAAHDLSPEGLRALGLRQESSTGGKVQSKVGCEYIQQFFRRRELSRFCAPVTPTNAELIILQREPDSFRSGA
jgi:hypothetical protein